MMRRQKGFTLMEVMVALGVIAVIIVSATGLFFRVLRGGGQSSATIQIEQNVQVLLQTIERFILNARQVVNVGGLECVSGSDVSGTTLTLLNFDDRTTQFSLVDGQIASNGGVITADKITVSNLLFTCTRGEGIPDKVTISFDAALVSAGEDINQTRTFTKEINLRNYQ